MADRNLDFDPTVTQVTPQLPDLGILQAGADLADHVATISANAKALNANANTALAFRQLDTQYRQDAAGNPNDPEALKNLQAQRAQIMAQQGQDVPAIAQREYMTGAIELQKSSDKMNELWSMHQQVRNAGSDLDSSQNSYYQIAGQAGRQFGQDGADMGNLGAVLNFESAQAAIRQHATPILGQPKVDDALKDFNANYVKSFVSNLAEVNPQAAAVMLQRPEITEHFGAQDINDMAALITRTQKQQTLLTNMQTTKADGSLSGIVNDPNTSYFDKRATIDKMDAAGEISPKAAAAARRVLKSTEDADSQTDTPVIADLVNRTYDLNARANTKADDYLNGVKNIHQQILQAQADGTLTAQDAGKVTKQVNDLTSAKLAAATNTAGGEFYQANKQFNVLPPEYRGQATRALFYAGTGQNWTPQQYSNQATQIIQKIGDQRRQQAAQTLNGIQNDDAFVKSIGFTNADIQETAKKYGMNPRDVILQLRAKAGSAARAKKSAVKSIAGGSEDGDNEQVASPPARATSSDNSMDDDAEMMQ